MNWRGWYAVGSILMMIVGAFKFITGIIGLFRDEWIVLGYNGYMLVDITGLAVWWLIVGALLVLAGMAAMVAKTWGRVVGIIGSVTGGGVRVLHDPRLPDLVDHHARRLRAVSDRVHRGEESGRGVDHRTAEYVGAR